VAIVAANLCAGELPFPLSFPLSPWNLEFGAGVALAMALARWRLPAPAPIGLAGAGAFLLLTWFATDIQDNPLTGRLAFGTCALLATAGAVEWERAAKRHWPRWVALAGASSYAVYLVHSVALSIFNNTLARLGLHSGPPELIAVLLTAAASAAGIAYHLAVERRLTAVAKRLWDRYLRGTPQGG
jgi:peptidoglycan/LPS O-acetylase OafA/YrhL